MQVLPLSGKGGPDSTPTGAFFRDLVRDASVFAFLFSLLGVLRPDFGDSTARLVLRFLADDPTGSGEVDMSTLGSRYSLSTRSRLYCFVTFSVVAFHQQAQLEKQDGCLRPG